MASTKVELKNLKELLKQIAEIADKELLDRLDTWLVKIGMKIAGDASRKLTRPGGGRFTGRVEMKPTSCKELKRGQSQDGPCKAESGRNETYFL